MGYTFYIGVGVPEVYSGTYFSHSVKSHVFERVITTNLFFF